MADSNAMPCSCATGGPLSCDECCRFAEVGDLLGEFLRIDLRGTGVYEGEDMRISENRARLADDDGVIDSNVLWRLGVTGEDAIMCEE